MLENGFESKTLFHHHSFLAKLFSVWLFFSKSPTFSNTYGHDLLSVARMNLRRFGRFWPKKLRFLSLFSVCLLTIQETTSNEINHLRGCGLQSVLVGLSDRERRFACMYAGQERVLQRVLRVPQLNDWYVPGKLANSRPCSRLNSSLPGKRPTSRSMTLQDLQPTADLQNCPSKQGIRIYRPAVGFVVTIYTKRADTIELMRRAAQETRSIDLV